MLKVKTERCSGFSHLENKKKNHISYTNKNHVQLLITFTLTAKNPWAVMYLSFEIQSIQTDNQGSSVVMV